MTRRPTFLELATAFVPTLVERGAQAVALVGSGATGDETEHSDLDLAVVGEGPHHTTEVYEDVLVSQGWASAEEQRRRLYDPGYLGTHVPGWRDAVVVHDPDGLAATIKEEALEWEWTAVAERCDEWVAESIAGLGEEVHKLVGALARGEAHTAAVQRSVLSLRLAPPIAIHRRLLYGSENRLWALVAEELGEEWSATQAAALREKSEDVETSCRSALRLFALAAEEVKPILNGNHLAVVERSLTASMQLRGGADEQPQSLSSTP